MIRSRRGVTPRWPRCKRAQTWRVCQRHPGGKWRQRRKQRLVTHGMIRCAQRVVLPAVARERGCRRTWEQLHALDWDAKDVSVAACVPPAATTDSRSRLWTRLPTHCDSSAAQDRARRSRGAQLCRQAGTTRAGRRTSVHCCKCRVSRPVRAKGALPRGNLCASVGT